MSFHVDSGQTRPGWAGRDEGELNALRQQFADLLGDVGGVNCNFNMTVNPRTLHQSRRSSGGRSRNRGRVSGLTFITLARLSDRGRHIRGRRQGDRPALGVVGMVNDVEDEMSELRWNDLYGVIKDAFPSYEAASYLGGTKTASSVKWLSAPPSAATRN